MISIRGKGVTYGEIWFSEEPEAPLPDILICRQRPRPWPSGKCRDFITLLIDLSQDEASLVSTFKKDTQYEIRRAAAKDGGKFRFLEKPAGEIDAFCSFFDKFAAAKGLGRAYRAWLDEAAAKGKLVLTCAVQNDEVRVWHAYVVSGEYARLLYSASLFRDEDKHLRALVGRLNRWLHWQDILEFRKRGFRFYDLGGVFKDETSPVAIGINRFKEEFGGVKTWSFDCTVALSWKGRVYLQMLSLRDRARSIWVRT